MVSSQRFSGRWLKRLSGRHKVYHMGQQTLGGPGDENGENVLTASFGGSSKRPMAPQGWAQALHYPTWQSACKEPPDSSSCPTVRSPNRIAFRNQGDDGPCEVCLLQDATWKERSLDEIIVYNSEFRVEVTGQ